MGAVAAIAAAQRARQERHLIEHLREEKAFSAKTATALRPQQRRGPAILRDLVRQGGIQQTGAQQTGESLYWLDEAAYAAMRAKREL